jgi:hypothetical protein
LTETILWWQALRWLEHRRIERGKILTEFSNLCIENVLYAKCYARHYGDPEREVWFIFSSTYLGDTTEHKKLTTLGEQGNREKVSNRGG